MSLDRLASLGLASLVALAFVIPTQACSGEGSAGAEGLCAPRTLVFCRCADRSEGTKRCAEDGRSFVTPCVSGASQTACTEVEDPLAGRPVDGGADAAADEGGADSARDSGADADGSRTPFCGDGQVTAGEACDDLNDTPTDGCDTNCTKVNGDPPSGGACPGHPVHVWANQTVTGTGSNNAPGYANTFSTASVACATTGGNTVTDHVYQVTPHADGILRVTLSSTATLNIVARTNCTDGTTTGATYCKDKTQTLSIAVTNGTPVYIAVDGGSLSNNVGTYTITFAHQSL
jgi:cysteine-rich repeat protein